MRERRTGGDGLYIRHVVSHGNPWGALAGAPRLADAEVAVIRPLGDDTFTIAARLRPSD